MKVFAEKLGYEQRKFMNFKKLWFPWKPVAKCYACIKKCTICLKFRVMPPDYEENVSLRQILDKLANMDDRIDGHFGSLTVEISRLSAEFKEEVEAIKTNLKSVQQSLQSAWDNINDLQAESKTHSDFKRTSQQTLDSYQKEINLLKTNSASAVIQNQQTEIRALQAGVENEKEKIIALENYLRRVKFAPYEHSREKRRELF